MKVWEQRIKKGTKVISYHKTLTYFFKRFAIKNIAFLEPKPGIPPTASHILDVMKKARQEGVKVALVENYFDPSVAKRVAKDVPGLKVKIIPVSVHGTTHVDSLNNLYEALVKSVEEK